MSITDLYMKHLDKMVEHYWNTYYFDMDPYHVSHNNEGDAFKHCYSQAELTLFLGETIAKLIGDKHEDNPDNPLKEKEMDLHNNIVGREIGKSVKQPFWIFTEWQDKVAEKIMQAMAEGKLITKV